MEQQPVQPDWNKAFAIAHITREDLVDALFPRAYVATITDEQMEHIAKKMGDAYNEWAYREDVIAAVYHVVGFSEKEEELYGEADSDPDNPFAP